MDGCILTKKEKGRVVWGGGVPDVHEFVENTGLFSTSVPGGLGEAVRWSHLERTASYSVA